MQVTDFTTSESITARRVWFDGRVASEWDSSTLRDVPVETATNIVYDGNPFAVMMITPGNFEDFAYGFSLTEGVIRNANDINTVAVVSRDNGIEVHVELSPDVAPRMQSRTRNTAGRTGCGLCGIDQLDAIPFADVTVRTASTVELSSIKHALETLDARQILNRATHAVHAAAWCDSQGAIVAIREDVGRHNALDKLIGALLRKNHQPDNGFLVITSRCSFEMVEKAAVYGARTIVAISAPTSLAVERAVQHNMTLLAIARSDSALAFHGAEHVRGPQPDAS